MSRVGKLPIKLDSKVKVAVSGQTVTMEGPNGKLSVPLPELIKIDVNEGVLTVVRPDDSRQARSYHGLARAILANVHHGVSKGWERRLDIRGVGYRVELKGKALHFALGYSHPIVYPLPEGVTAEVEKPRSDEGLPTVGLILKSADRQLLGAVAVKIRSLRPPEPYKGKGVKYGEERVKRKEGKSGA